MPQHFKSKGVHGRGAIQHDITLGALTYTYRDHRHCVVRCRLFYNLPDTCRFNPSPLRFLHLQPILKSLYLLFAILQLPMAELECIEPSERFGRVHSRVVEVRTAPASRHLYHDEAVSEDEYTSEWRLHLITLAYAHHALSSIKKCLTILSDYCLL